jgi:ABC-2 type transport system ATP-binding protein
MNSVAIKVENISKSYKETHALQGVTFEVKEGSILGLLGPNGAGKTTLVRILTTLLKPDGGRAYVNGINVAENSKEARYQIGLAGQYAAVDEILTGKENLYMFCRLYHLNENDSLNRANELLEKFQLIDAANSAVKTYSGGMRRRLDLAASLVNKPKILFLDEPTTGLDPQSRLALWEIIRDLVREGTTVLITTQYLDEADKLADNIVVINYGKIIAEGTPAKLKSDISGEVIELHVKNKNQAKSAADSIAEHGSSTPSFDLETGEVILPIKDGTKIVMQVLRTLDDQKIEIDDIIIRKPTLDEVFLKLTSQKNSDKKTEKINTPLII